MNYLKDLDNNFDNILLILFFGSLILMILFKLKSVFFSDFDPKIDLIIKRLMRGCSRWAIASKQDKSPLIAMLHANYAAGYLWALKDVFSDTQIERASGISNIIDFQNDIVTIQDTATKRLINSCKSDIMADLTNNDTLFKMSHSDFE
jgi:hypothetical protein